MKKEMLINVAQPEECRIAIVEDGLLEELYIERASQDNYVGNIYRGRIVNIEPSIQAAFVDFGVGRNGFLHISDVEPQYFRQGGYDPKNPTPKGEAGKRYQRDFHDREEHDDAPRGGEYDEQDDRESFGALGDAHENGRMDDGGDRDFEEGEPELVGEAAHRGEAHRGAARGANGGQRGQRGNGRGGPRQGGKFRQRIGARPRYKPPIQEIFARGDEVLVQVIKEGIGSKGPTLSTYISIPGRYLVLMPALGRVGVSRKIEDEDARRRLRDMMLELNPPKGLGFIVRTAGVERTKRELSGDLAYLVRLWKVIVRRLRKLTGPGDVYEESDMIIRTIRDIFSSDVDAIYIDEPNAYQRAKEFLELVMPRHVERLHLYEGKEPLYHKYRLEDEIAGIHRRVVPLRSGGSIVIDPTEALVAIDVNSGSFRADDNAEETAYQMNLHAAREIARQLRLRDLGGVIVNDFIDMRREKHRRGVERALRDAVRRDRARTKILRTSPFGLIEMTRQRIRPSLKRSVFKDCPCCQGRAVVKTAESMAIEAQRLMMLAMQRSEIRRLTVRCHAEVAAYLNNRKRKALSHLEEESNVSIQILGSEDYHPEFLEITCQDEFDRQIAM